MLYSYGYLLTSKKPQARRRRRRYPGLQSEHTGVDKVLAAIQKAVLLKARHIVRSFLDHQKEGSQPFLDRW